MLKKEEKVIIRTALMEYRNLLFKAFHGTDEEKERMEKYNTELEKDLEYADNGEGSLTGLVIDKEDIKKKYKKKGSPPLENFITIICIIILVFIKVFNVNITFCN